MANITLDDLLRARVAAKDCATCAVSLHSLSLTFRGGPYWDGSLTPATADPMFVATHVERSVKAVETELTRIQNFWEVWSERIGRVRDYIMRFASGPVGEAGWACKDTVHDSALGWVEALWEQVALDVDEIDRCLQVPPSVGNPSNERVFEPLFAAIDRVPIYEMLPPYEKLSQTELRIRPGLPWFPEGNRIACSLNLTLSRVWTVIEIESALAKRSLEQEQATAAKAALAEHEHKQPKGSRKPADGGNLDRIIAALTKHHRYSNGICENYDPIGARALAEQAGLGRKNAGRVTEFFQASLWQRHKTYVQACNRRDPKVAFWLTTLNRETPDWNTYGGEPPGESSENGEG